MAHLSISAENIYWIEAEHQFVVIAEYADQPICNKLQYIATLYPIVKRVVWRMQFQIENAEMELDEPKMLYLPRTVLATGTRVTTGGVRIIKRSNYLDFQGYTIDLNSLQDFTVRDKIELCEVLWLLRRDGLLDDHIYQKVCDYSYPEYKTANTDECMVFWQSHQSLLSTFQQSIKNKPIKSTMLRMHLEFILGAQHKDVKKILDMVEYERCNYCVNIMKSLVLSIAIKNRSNIKQARNDRKENQYADLVTLLCTRTSVHESLAAFAKSNRDSYVKAKLLLGRLEPKLLLAINSIANGACKDKSKLKETILTPNMPNVRLNRLNHSQHRTKLMKLEDNEIHYVQLKDGVTKQQLKVLNSLFPYTSAADSHKMTMHLADMVYTILHPRGDNPYVLGKTREERTSLVNNVLRNIAVGTNQTLVLTALIATLGIKSNKYIFKHILDEGLLLLPKDDCYESLKSLTTTVRRTFRSADGSKLTEEESNSLCYWHMAFGRSDFTTHTKTNV